MKIPTHSPETVKGAIVAEIEEERVIWLGIRDRFLRSGKQDSQLKFEFNMSNHCMDALLDRLFEHIVEFEPIETRDVMAS